MKKRINYQKQNYMDKSSLQLEDSKWKIYKTFNENPENNNEIIEDNNNNIDNIKTAIYTKIKKNSNNLQILSEKYKNLKKENIYLKQVIRSKDKLISDFGILFQQFKDKFKIFEDINQSLKRKLMNNDLLNRNQNENLNIIENDYTIKLNEKDKMLEKMREELIYMHDEYKNLTNNIEKVNNYIHDNNYTELKEKVNDLLKEKDYLIKQNKKREKRIIDLIKKYEKNEENEKIDNDNLFITFKNQENEYIKTINMLQNRIIDKDNEIKMIKEEFKKILND
jgi:hypothetical protein